MAFVDDPLVDIPADCTAYVAAWDTKEQLEIDDGFCPLCEVSIKYTTSGGYKPMAQLAKVIQDVQAENKLSPKGFIMFVARYYEEKIRSVLVDVLHWQKKKEEKVTKPAWPVESVYRHFNQHVADSWFNRQEALRQTNAMLQRTANTCMNVEGPPNPNTVKTYIELQKLQKQLRVPEPFNTTVDK